MESLGSAVKLPFSLAGTTPTPMPRKAVDAGALSAQRAECVGMDGYTGEFGWAFSGIFGVGAAQPDDSCCTQPLRALPGNIGQRYLVHANFAKPLSWC